jgi:beta-galactosidase
MDDVVKKAGLWGDAQTLRFPVITKEGVNTKGKTIHYLFNYSAKPVTVRYPFENGKELLSGDLITKNNIVELEAWDLRL